MSRVSHEWHLAPVDDGAADWSAAAPVAGPFWSVGALNARQRQVLLAMLRFHDAHDGWPSARRLAEDLPRLSTRQVIYQLVLLQQAGWVCREPRRQAAAIVVAPVELFVQVPPLRVAA